MEMWVEIIVKKIGKFLLLGKLSLTDKEKRD